MKKTYNVAILGATGVIGRTMLSILQQRHFPIEKIYFLASERSNGMKLTFNQKEHEVLDAKTFDFSDVDIALFSAGKEVACEYAPLATQAGTIVIDNSSAFRLVDDIPLIIPEVNANELERYQQRKIIANPNCSTIQMLVALFPIYCKVGIERINVATYQSVSGSGKNALDELWVQTQAVLNGKTPQKDYYPETIAFNVFPQVDDFTENGYTREEMKMYFETQKIFRDKQIKVNATAVRVPVLYGHSEAINIETKSKISAKEAEMLLKNAPGVALFEDHTYPSAVTHAAYQDNVFVGRVHEDISYEKGLNLWVVADNIRKGGALNAVQIAEKLIQQYI